MVCSKCKEEKPEQQFKHRSDNSAKHKSQCRTCDALDCVRWRQVHAEYVRLKSKEYRESHKEKRHQQWKGWAAKNKDYLRECHRVYRHKNIERFRECARLRKVDKTKACIRQKKYRDSHKRQRREYEHRYELINRKKILERKRKWSSTDEGRRIRNSIRMRRIARQKESSGSFTGKQFKEKCEYYGWRCYLCGVELTPKTVHQEHRIPLSRGGSNWIANIAPSCGRCNCRKWNRTEKEYREIMISIP